MNEYVLEVIAVVGISGGVLSWIGFVTGFVSQLRKRKRLAKAQAEALKALEEMIAKLQSDEPVVKYRGPESLKLRPPSEF